MKQAFFYTMTSAFSFSVMNVFVKLLGQTMPIAEVTFFRGLIGTIAILGYMWAKDIPFSKNDRGLLTIRGLLGGLGTLCNFIALAHMKLADATLLFQLTGVFVFIFSALILKERIPQGSGKWLLTILVAVTIMLNPWTYDSFTFYALFAVAGAALAAGAYTTIRKISQRGQHSTHEIMAYFLITSMVVGAVFMKDGFVVPDMKQTLLILIIGGISVFAQFFMTGAFVVTNAVIAQFMQYIGVFFGAFWGFVVFDEALSYIMILGGVVLFTSSVMLAKLKSSQEEENRNR